MKRKGGRGAGERGKLGREEREKDGGGGRYLFPGGWVVWVLQCDKENVFSLESERDADKLEC